MRGENWGVPAIESATIKLFVRPNGGHEGMSLIVETAHWASCFCCLCGLHQIDTVASVPTILQAVGVVAVAVT